MIRGRSYHTSQGEQGLVIPEPYSEKGLPALPNRARSQNGPAFLPTGRPGRRVWPSWLRACTGSQGQSSQESLPWLSTPTPRRLPPPSCLRGPSES